MEQRFTFIKTNEVKEDFDSEERVEVEVVMEDNDALRVTATGATDVALSIMEIS